jgi:hypothetical protein
MYSIYVPSWDSDIYSLPFPFTVTRLGFYTIGLMYESRLSVTSEWSDATVTSLISASLKWCQSVVLYVMFTSGTLTGNVLLTMIAL